VHQNKVYVVVSDETGEAKAIFSNASDAKSRCGSHEHVEDFIVDEVINNELEGKQFYRVHVSLCDHTIDSVVKASPGKPGICLYPESSPTKAYIYVWATSPEEALSTCGLRPPARRSLWPWNKSKRQACDVADSKIHGFLDTNQNVLTKDELADIIDNWYSYWKETVADWNNRPTFCRSMIYDLKSRIEAYPFQCRRHGPRTGRQD